MEVELSTPAWAQPLLVPSRYKGTHGGRASGKSHLYAEMLIERHLVVPNCASVCIREVQNSIKMSVKRLLEMKISAMNAGFYFEVQDFQIKSTVDKGIIIFQGMQNHTADSIKSLESFDTAWFEEASSASQRSLDLLRPTIRKPGSELWFTWNPNEPTDPVDVLLRGPDAPPDSVVVQANYADNPWLPEVIEKEIEFDRATNPDKYEHVWMGGYLSITEEQVLFGKWAVQEFVPQSDWSGPYFGADWGFAVDPSTLMKVWVHKNRLYVEHELYGMHVEVDHLPKFFNGIADSNKYIIRGDSARPEVVSYLQRNGYPKTRSVEKWKGSVEDGISKLRSFEKIVIHPRCKNTINEAKYWRWKKDKLTDEITAVLQPGNDHCWDGVRYAIAPLVKANTFGDLLRRASSK